MIPAHAKFTALAVSYACMDSQETQENIDAEKAEAEAHSQRADALQAAQARQVAAEEEKAAADAEAERLAAGS